MELETGHLMVDGSFGGSKKEREEKNRDWWGYMKVHPSDCCSYIDTFQLIQDLQYIASDTISHHICDMKSFL